MRIISNISKKQYAFVRGSRATLFKYCETIQPQDFISENHSFGNGGSIRNLLVHIANSYQYWVGSILLQKEFTRQKYEDNKNMDDVTKLFIRVNRLLETFFEHSINWEKEISFEKDGIKRSANPFKIFSHVITHEFHHKGQILSLGRHWGYIPEDTDILL